MPLNHQDRIAHLPRQSVYVSAVFQQFQRGVGMQSSRNWTQQVSSVQKHVANL